MPFRALAAANYRAASRKRPGSATTAAPSKLSQVSGDISSAPNTLLPEPPFSVNNSVTDAVISRHKPTLNSGRIDGTLRVLLPESFTINGSTQITSDLFLPVTSDESHMSIFAGLQMLGLGSERVVRVPADEQGRLRVDELRRTVSGIQTPILVCAQAGNVNTGAFDPIAVIVDCLRDHQSWLHVDGAFGLWAATSPAHRSLVRGIELADSVATDGHKWLNVPYDCGLVFVRDAAAHQAAMSLNAPYYITKGATERDNCDWVPEASRRARGFTVYAALRFLGRNGVSDLVERCCRLAQRMAERLAKDPSVTILNDVVLNQVLVRFAAPGTGASDDEFTAEVIRRVQDDGTCWLGGTTWHGMQAMRISVSNWSTREADVDASADAIIRCARK
jgi:glutamate/tyrosine decarboxylase-like PLP-dependent enzyme